MDPRFWVKWGIKVRQGQLNVFELGLSRGEFRLVSGFDVLFHDIRVGDLAQIFQDRRFKLGR